MNELTPEQEAQLFPRSSFDEQLELMEQTELISEKVTVSKVAYPSSSLAQPIMPPSTPYFSPVPPLQAKNNDPIAWTQAMVSSLDPFDPRNMLSSEEYIARLEARLKRIQSPSAGKPSLLTRDSANQPTFTAEDLMDDEQLEHRNLERSLEDFEPLLGSELNLEDQHLSQNQVAPSKEYLQERLRILQSEFSQTMCLNYMQATEHSESEDESSSFSSESSEDEQDKNQTSDTHWGQLKEEAFSSSDEEL